MTRRWSDQEYAEYIEGKVAAAKPPATADHLCVTLPLRLVNPNNNRTGWWIVSKRNKQHHRSVAIGLKGYSLPPLPATVTITRIGQRKMDDDNLQAAAKSVRDAVALAYGVDDGSELYEWRYAQEHTRKAIGLDGMGPPPYACRIEIRSTRNTSSIGGSDNGT